ncbi:hypothetical protein EET67_15485 [Pseudaminobacter arsenicus]|uniref:Uncharacterized protein n=1 Tax=Borborobacter arsenicus TaxID=1851146 RepID=A0A432V477_9HYPH|nr:hypothetical protein [Pseudaminobacter arsenicus]RUM96938.1 hypothetical protein EET67_15485 [Pseudaminobacter arsenicus]
MTKIALTLAIALATAGSAYAHQDAAPVSVIENAAGITLATSAVEPARFGDAAPATVIVNVPGAADYSSAAAIGATSLQQVSPRVLGGSN